MAEQQTKHDIMKFVIPSLVAGAVGLFFVGSQQDERNKANDIGGIDVLRAEVTGLKNRVDAIDNNTIGRDEIDSKFSSTNDTIIRRFGEDVEKPIAQVREDAEKNEDEIQELHGRISALEAIQGKK